MKIISFEKAKRVKELGEHASCSHSHHHGEDHHDHVHEHGKDHIPTDKIGMALSFICLIHCLAGPILLILLPGLNQFISHDAFHVVMLGFVVPVAALSFFKSYKSHGIKLPLKLGAAGTVFLVLGILIPMLMGHDHALHDEHLNTSTLETGFTVLGGIILAYAHYINFKQCQCKD
jgi:hypothetical protein